MEEYSYTSTHPLGHTGPVTGTLYLYLEYYRLQNIKYEQVGTCRSVKSAGTADDYHTALQTTRSTTLLPKMMQILSQGISHIVWKPKVQYRMHKYVPLAYTGVSQ